MKCQRMEVLLSCYLDDALSPAQKEQVTAHLEECSSCSSEYRTLKKNQMVLSSLSRKEVPAEVWPALRNRIQQERTKVVPISRFSWQNVRRSLLIAACLMVAFFFSVVAVGYYGGDDPGPQLPQVSQRNFIEGHARFIGEVDPMSDKAAWAYVRSHQAIQGVLDEENPGP